MTGTYPDIRLSALFSRAARALALTIRSAWWSHLVIVRSQNVMWLESPPFEAHSSHDEKPLGSGDVTHAYSAISQLPALTLLGPVPKSVFASGTRPSRSSMPTFFSSCW